MRIARPFDNDLLRSRNEVIIMTPIPSDVRPRLHHRAGEPLHNKDLTDELIADSDCVIICTEHSDVDYARVVELAGLIVDTRNALSEDVRNGGKAKIIRL